MMSFNPSPSTSATATWTPPSKLVTVRLERRQQIAILGVHVNFRHDAPSRRRNDLVDAIAGEIAGGDPNAALEGFPYGANCHNTSPVTGSNTVTPCGVCGFLSSPMTITVYADHHV
jgi:hypothetical protein